MSKFVFIFQQTMNKMVPRLTIISIILAVAPAASFADVGADTYLPSVPEIPAKNVGIYIEDINTGEVVLDVNGEIPLVPASVTKAVTAATVLNLSSPDDCFITEIGVDGPLKNGILKGNVVICATGDPTIESEHFPERLGVADSIAATLQRMGVREIEGRVLCSYPSAMEEGVPAGWMSEDLMWAYGTAHHALNYADNKMVLSMPSKTTSPYVPGLKINFVPSRRGTKIEMDHKHITVTGRRNRKSSTALSNPDPEATMCSAVENAITGIGINIDGNRIKHRALRDVIYTHSSPHYSDILKSMMFRSDNMMTEGMLRSVVQGRSRHAAIAEELSFWADNGVDTCGIVIEDGSGLSRNNRISPYFLADILVWMARNNNQVYLQCFPKAGIEGTMRNFMKGTSLEGRLATKTGSMKNVQCYAGYLLDGAGMPSHVVVIMANELTSSRANLKKAIGKLLIEKFG